MYLSRIAYKIIYVSAVYIQTGMRGMAARNDLRFRKRTQASVVIQSHYKGYLARTRFQTLKKATIAVQCSWRRTIARRELRKLKMAAREAKALEAAKINLEKQVEELTLSLQSEKRMREAKTEENEKLQSTLHEIEIQFQETKAMLIQEREAAKKAAEQIQDIPINVIDNELINKLTTENEQLKDLVSSLEKKTTHDFSVDVSDNELIHKLTEENEQLKEKVNSLKKKTIPEFPIDISENELINKLNSEKEHLEDLVSILEKRIDETERKYEESNKQSEERMNQIIETETKMIELKTSMQRLEEKLSDMETENQVLRKQALLSSSSRRMSSLATAPPLENGHQAPPSSIPAKPFGSESMRRSQMERQQESIDALFKCVTKDLGFSEGKPVAAFTIYNSLLHWKTFEAEKTSIFDHLIQLIGSAIEDSNNNDSIAYWLSNTSSLLFHLQRCLRVPSTRKPPTPTSFFGRMTQVLI
ncbi:hypothetical protein RIF29_14791 [Crotalaria pallida]|uniref:Dilute domain-containing protein n=1 Tax=Crotalaria pallida TaxID=3830 RepID=A0AAN9ID20_CROPI